ncbi:MAG TPA: amidase [Stellaceae bacterium]|jgi:Asp-tRNA(Asn)/Glu-tRNA(Gln) amidotransferase A subunit family amidase|nr:amidase [Stellaceae bacterium]
MAGFIEYEKHDATGLAALIAGGQVSATEVLEAAIERAERWQPSINAITIPLYEHARAAARTGLPAGSLSGVPFLLKDLGAQLTGTRTSGSGKLWEDFVADHDSTLVARYCAAGLNIFGKSASPEMGLAPSTEPAMYGPCRNPWNLAYSAGGSSGGSAAAVAARILPIAHATDGGGSIRIPASACGLFGLKTTRARNPSGPDVGEGWGGQSVAHCVSISVRDSAALLDASAGPDIGDPYWAPPSAGRFVDEVGRAPGRLRIALCVTPWNDEPVDAECRQAAEDAAQLCEGLGHDVAIGRPEFDTASFRAATRTLVAANVLATLEARAKAVGKTLEASDVEPLTWWIAELGRGYTAADYARSVTTIHSVGRVVARFFANYDILLTPTMCSPPLPIGVLSLSTSDRTAYLTAVNRSIGFTSLFNASGHPAANLPLHWSAQGLPVGVQIAAPFGDEATIFRLAAQIETTRPWKDHRPPLTGVTSRRIGA